MSTESDIINNLNHPKELERLYRENKTAFETSFDRIYADHHGHPVAQAWHERLHFDSSAQTTNRSKYDLTFVVIASLIAGLLVKLPGWIGMIEEYYYACNFSFIAFPMIALYFIWKNNTPLEKWWPVALAMLASCVYINLLPMDDDSDSYVLACIHLPMFTWALVGFAYGRCEIKNQESRIAFLRFNGDLLIMNIIILMAGALLTGLTLALFSMIKMDITSFYMQNIVFWGIAASPIVSTYLVQINPSLVNKVSPVIARIFSPMALITLLAYLTTVVVTGQDPYTDRDFLILFNLLLVAVMALVLFATAESTTRKHSTFNHWVILLLVAVTIIINSIALSAILFRISEWGITANRLAVFVGNILILTNLIWILKNMIRMSAGKSEIKDVERCISSFLPIYTAWTAVVVFLFPVIFGFK